MKLTWKQKQELQTYWGSVEKAVELIIAHLAIQSRTPNLSEASLAICPKISNPQRPALATLGQSYEFEELIVGPTKTPEPRCHSDERDYPIEHIAKRLQRLGYTTRTGPTMFMQEGLVKVKGKRIENIEDALARTLLIRLS